MKIKNILLSSKEFPEKLRPIPDAPKRLYVVGAPLNELLEAPAVAIVGSRKVSAYGQAVTNQLATALAKAGVVVISGLAYGVDGVAQKAALQAGGRVIAVLAHGLDHIYPAAHRHLAEQIVRQGGAVMSEYAAGSGVYKSNFIARNRIVSGLSDAVLITEAAVKSGTLHTADFALQQGREVLAVPGNITSPTSAGTNNLIKAGATPVTDVVDVLRALGIEIRVANRQAPTSHDPREQTLLTLLFAGIENGAELLEQSKLDVSQFNQTLTMLEIQGRIRPLGNNHWGLA